MDNQSIECFLTEENIIPPIRYKYLRSFFNSLHIRQGTSFIFFQRPFTVWIGPYTEEDQKQDNPPFFYVPSTVTNGYDIYIAQQLKARLRKIVVLHESVEALMREYLEQTLPIINTEYGEKAHSIASIIEEQYAKDTFSEDVFQDYLTLRAKFK